MVAHLHVPEDIHIQGSNIHAVAEPQTDSSAQGVETGAAEKLLTLESAAVSIYKNWLAGNRQAEELARHFTEAYAIPDELALKFATHYHRSAVPALSARAKLGWLDSAKVFADLGLATHGHWPQRELGWWVMKELFGAEIFYFDIQGQAAKNGLNQIKLPPPFCDKEGQGLNFAEAAMLGLNGIGVPQHIKKKANFLFTELHQAVAEDLVRVLMKDFIFPPQRVLQLIASAINRGLKGEELLFVGAFCPDYGYRETGNPFVPYEYTFEHVSGGVGLVAQQFLRVLPALVEFCGKHGIRTRVRLGIGDFEANDPKILERVRVSQEEFVVMCQASLAAFRQELPDIPMDLQLFERELACGRWQPYIAESLNRMKCGDFGAIQCCTDKRPTDEIKFIATARQRFYSKWYNRSFSIESSRIKVLEQGAEYAAMGRIHNEDCRGRPAIILSCDSPPMNVFQYLHQTEEPLGVLCATRKY